MPIPDIPEHDYATDGLTDREKLMRQPSFILDINNNRELGEILATFDRASFPNPVVGVAEMAMVDGIRTLTVTLVCDETELYQCALCSLIPEHPTSDNPGICVHCGLKVCQRCWKGHEKGHWRPVQTIGGKEIPF